MVYHLTLSRCLSLLLCDHKNSLDENIKRNFQSKYLWYYFMFVICFHFYVICFQLIFCDLQPLLNFSAKSEKYLKIIKMFMYLISHHCWSRMVKASHTCTVFGKILRLTFKGIEREYKIFYILCNFLQNQKLGPLNIADTAYGWICHWETYFW